MSKTLKDVERKIMYKGVMTRIDTRLFDVLSKIQQRYNLRSIREASARYVDTSAYSPFIADILIPPTRKMKRRSSY